MRDISTKTAGSLLTPDEFNDIPSEIENVITDAGIILSSGDLTQLSKAIATYVASGDFYADSGAVNAYVLSPLGSKKAPPSYSDGMRFKFVPDNTNTGASTINVGSIGVIDIVLNGNALTGGELPAGQTASLRYDTTSGDAFIESVTNSLFIDGRQVELSGTLLAAAAYASRSYNVSSQDTQTTAVRFRSNGSKMYTIGRTNNNVNQYTLSTPWDVTTASYDSVNFNIFAQEPIAESFTFSTDGSKMYVIGIGNETVYQYTLTTPWNLATISYDSVSFSVVAQDGSPSDVSFKADGTKMYIVGFLTDSIYQYTLTTPWDLTTASYDSISFNVSSQDSISRGVYFKLDGKKMYMIGDSNDSVFEYALFSAWDISTAAYTGVSFDCSDQVTNVSRLEFSQEKPIFYINSSNIIYQYTAGILRVL